MLVTYSSHKISYPVIHCMHAPMQRFQNVLAFYACKIFMKLTPEPNAIKDFFHVNTGVFLYLQEKNTDCNAINTCYLYLQKEFTDKIYRRISPVITGVFL
jgi:hypothetical protein